MANLRQSYKQPGHPMQRLSPRAGERSITREEERLHIARELHDGAGQLLAALSIGLSTIQDTSSLEEAKQRAAMLGSIAGRLFDEIGRVTRGLHPASVQEFGLAAALQRLMSEISQSRGLRVEADFDCLDSLNLELGTQMALYRIIQEALANVAKHAQATQAWVVFNFRAPTLVVTIRDNGQGLAVEENCRSKHLHLGLRTMRERAEMLGGKLCVQSTPGRGTLVRAAIPVARG